MHILTILLVAVFLYYLQYYSYRNKWKQNLYINLTFSSNHAFCGDDLVLKEVVRNQKALPLPFLRVKFMTSRDLKFYDSKKSSVSDRFYRDEFMTILMYQQLTRSLKFHCAHRGYYTIQQMEIVCNDIFLSAGFAEISQLDEYLYVYPTLLDNKFIDISFKKMMGSILTKRFFNEDPFEFAGIREYQPYDNLKNVNWKASAKTGALKVNVHDYTSSQQVRIFLNLETQTLLAHEELMEESIRLAATYATSFINSGIPVSLYTNGLDLLLKKPIVVTAGSTLDHIERIYEGLSRIDTNLQPPTFMPFFQSEQKESNGQDYLLLISTYQKDDLQQYLISLKQNKQDFSWIVPLESDIANEVYTDLSNDTFIYMR